MKKLCFWILIISVVVLLTLFLTGCDGDKTSEDDSSAASADGVSDSETWLDMSKAEKCEVNYFSEVIITQIDDDCFYGKPTDSNPIYVIKFNGTLDEKWCVGDNIKCTYENAYRDVEAMRIECDILSVTEGTQPGDYTVAKPVIYLYPENELDVSVKLELDGKLTCTYPSYKNGWTVKAYPDGTLIDAEGKVYNYLYWEGEDKKVYDLSKGFCIKGEDTAEFLEWALTELGLNRREANEFIVYWLPLMQNNPYNVISFQGEAYTDCARLDIAPAPDTLIRVFMTWRASDTEVELEAQQLNAPERVGFTVVEWGGAQIG